MTAQIYNLEAYRMKRKARHTIGTVGAMSRALADSDYATVGGVVVPLPRRQGYMTAHEMNKVARRLRLLHTAAERKDMRDRHVKLWEGM